MMYNVLIIDTLYAEALKIADILSDKHMNCRVMDIASIGFIGGQRFLKRKPDIVFLDTNLCAMRIDEFLTLAKQATHRYCIVMLTNENYDTSLLPEFCFALNKSNISHNSIGQVLKKIDTYYQDIESVRPPKTDKELFDGLIGESSYSVQRILAEKMKLPMPFNIIKPVLLQFRTDAEYFGVLEALDKIMQKDGYGKLIPLGGQLAVVLISGKQTLNTDYLADLLKAHVNMSWVLIEDSETPLYNLSAKIKRLRDLSQRLYFYLNGSRIIYSDIPEIQEVGIGSIRAWSDGVISKLLNFEKQAIIDSIGEMYLTILVEAANVESLQMVRMHVTQLLHVLHGMLHQTDEPRKKIWPQCRFGCIEDECRHIIREFTTGMEKLHTNMISHSAMVQDASKYLYENITSPISLQDVAASINASKEYLCTTFRKEMHVGIVEFINRTKILLACYLLSTDRRTKETADVLGYTDNGYFERVFKKMMGITPAQYLRNCAQYRETYAALEIIEERR